jgi:predicted  nucleic acid-binding Zn-ribbon protein
MSINLNSFYTSYGETQVKKPAASSNVCFTLPITCQICLGKVKDPSVCPNLHAFCSFCIDIWLEKSKHCPTCRVAISAETPCKRILGGAESSDDVDVIKPTDFSHPSTRKARLLGLYQQYEDEIDRLNKYIDTLNVEIGKLKEQLTRAGSNSALTAGSTSPQIDMLQMLKSKLQTAQTELDASDREREELRESNKKLDSENSILIQEIGRLRASLSEKNSQMSSRYTMAALESRVDTYEREIRQLQKALEKSDKYISELERRHEKTNQEETVSTSEASCCNLTKNTSKTANTSTKPASLGSDFVSPPNQTNKKAVIANDRFYGSPSKMALTSNSPNVKSSPQRANSSMVVPQPTISSFGDRIKRNLFQPPSNSVNQELIQEKASLNVPDQPAAGSSQRFLFSPMKRLRLDDQQQPQAPVTFVSSQQPASTATSEFIECIELLNQAERKVQNNRQAATTPPPMGNANSADNEPCESHYTAYSLPPGSSGLANSHLNATSGESCPLTGYDELLTQNQQLINKYLGLNGEI